MATKWKPVSFFSLTKAEKLALLGDMYEKLRSVGPRRVYLDVIHSDNEERPGCGSVGCVVGWAATERSIADRLRVRLQGYNMELGTHDLDFKHQALSLVRMNEVNRHKPVCTKGTYISCVRIFQEYPIAQFLFSGSTYKGRWSHYRTALARLLYLGYLVDSDVDLKADGWAKEENVSDAFVNKHVARMTSHPFVLAHLEKLRPTPTAKPAVTAIG